MLKKCRISIALVIVGLVISGLTAFPLLTELDILAKLLVGKSGSLNPGDYDGGLTQWILMVRRGLQVSYRDYPFIAYGTDWLAFGHIVIAMFYALPFRDPVRYQGVLHVGVLASVLVIPLALICGHVREIPLGWRLIDCAFGVLCLFPLAYAIRASRRLEQTV